MIEQPSEYQINWDPGKDVTYEILIANLGGYDKAKHELELKEQGSILQCCAAVTADMIRYALLQYRRQHNIFENGDWVVYEITGTIGDFIDHIKLATGHPYCRVDFGLCDVGLILLKHIRHATDEEIAAGKRLEGNS